MFDQNVSGQNPAGQANPQENNAQAQTTIPANGAQAEQKPAEQQAAQFDEALYRKIAREEAARVAQSFTDKASGRIMEQVQAQIAALELNRGTLGLTDEQVEAAKQKIVVQAMTAKPQQTQPGAPDKQTQPDNQTQTQQFHPIIVQSMTLMENENVTIEEGDPEFAQYIRPHFAKPDVDQTFLMDTVRAIDAKKARLVAQTQNAAVRSAGGANNGGQPQPKPLTAEEKISQGLKGNWQSSTPPPQAR